MLAMGPHVLNSALVTPRHAREMERKAGNVMCGFVFDMPGPSEPPRRLLLPSGPSVNFTWAATWWGIRVNQVKSASVGLRLDDFIVEVAGVSLCGLEEVLQGRG